MRAEGEAGSAGGPPGEAGAPLAPCADEVVLEEVWEQGGRLAWAGGAMSLGVPEDRMPPSPRGPRCAQWAPSSLPALFRPRGSAWASEFVCGYLFCVNAALSVPHIHWAA